MTAGQQASAAGGGFRVSLTNATVSDSNITPGTTTVSYRVDADGNVYTNDGGGDTVHEQWITPLGGQALYEVRATLVSGTNPSGTMNTWQQLNTDRTWSKIQSIPGVNECTMTIEIGVFGSSTPLVSCLVGLTAEVTV